MSKFIGRKREISSLKRLLELPSASLVVVKGRRRIGKSRLLEEFGRSFDRSYFFSGIAPSGRVPLSAQSQRDEFAGQLAKQFDTTPDRFEDWSDLFWHIAQKTQHGSVLIVLDEITWMGSADPAFLGKLKIAWDMYFKKNDHLVLALCGSMSVWIEENILSSTAFVGRVMMTLTLRELPLNDCAKFWKGAAGRISAFEKLKILSVTGGIPLYLESINPILSAEQNIQMLCFSEDGLLLKEFDSIFSDLFDAKQVLYQKIVTCLAAGPADQATINQRLCFQKSGRLASYLAHLKQSGFIAEDFTWIIKSGEFSRLRQYRLSDNYTRFYLKYILPNRAAIENDTFEGISMHHFKGWHAMMGLQFENLVLSNVRLVRQHLQINPNDIVMENPFFQKKTTRQAGCQIDYMIQTKHHVVYVCEIKFSEKEIGMFVVDEVQEKINRLKLPKHYSCRAVLIHCNGVTEPLQSSHFFSNIIDVSEFLEPSA